jgi:hypothetical protein
VRGAGERGPGHHELPRHDPLADDLPFVVDVVDEEVERAHPLGEAALDRAPLGGRQEARDEVEREGPVAGGPAVRPGRVEGDALLDEDGVALRSRSLPSRPSVAVSAAAGPRGRSGASNSSSKKPGAGE